MAVEKPPIYIGVSIRSSPAGVLFSTADLVPPSLGASFSRPLLLASLIVRHGSRLFSLPLDGVVLLLLFL